MRHVETSIEVAAAAPAVVRAFLELPALEKWWHVDRGVVDPRIGGVWALAWQRSEHGFKYFITGRIDALTDSRLQIGNLVYFNPERAALGPMALTIESDGKRMTIRQDGYREGGDWDWYYEAVSKAWPMVAEDIKAFLEG